MFIVFILIAGIVAGGAIGFVVRQQMTKGKVGNAEGQANTLIKQAQEKQKMLELEAKERSLKIIEDAKRQEQALINKIAQTESRVEKREASIESKLESLEKERERYQAGQKELEESREKLRGEQEKALAEIDKLKQQQMERLEKIASIPQSRAETLVMELTEQRMKDRVMKEIKKYEEQLKLDKERLAKRIIAMSIWRLASEVTTEHSTSTIQLPNEEMKGRIIGRDGRNIKTLENLTGVELLVDETPNAIVISGFNAIRRYVAKLTIENLIADGRIHPGHIEESVEKAKRDVQKKIKEAGQAALVEVGLQHQHPQLAEVAGRLLFRTSYGQNQLKHAVEVSTISGLIATELGADVKVAKAAGFLHDIGKAIDHDVPGTHIEIGDKLLKKFGFSEAVIRAAETHHETVDFEAPEDWIVAAADAISAARPGARRNTVQEYVKRVQELENIVKSFEGVASVFAIEAGRELRVMVEPEKIDDLKAKKLAHAISDKIEQEMTYPGEIKIAVIRETRAVDYAR
jgi:ribonuclease Y